MLSLVFQPNGILHIHVACKIRGGGGGGNEDLGGGGGWKILIWGGREAGKFKRNFPTAPKFCLIVQVTLVIE